MIKLHRFKPKGEHYHQRIIRTHDHYYVVDGKLTEKQLEQWQRFDQELNDIQACAMSQALRKAIKEFDKTHKVPDPAKIAEGFFRW